MQMNFCIFFSTDMGMDINCHSRWFASFMHSLLLLQKMLLQKEKEERKKRH